MTGHYSPSPTAAAAGRGRSGASTPVRWLAKRLHRLYKLCISPLFGQSCRFTPYCSDYALEAVNRHGLLKGGLLSIWRLLRCQPFARGGHDPVPPRTGSDMS